MSSDDKKRKAEGDEEEPPKKEAKLADKEADAEEDDRPVLKAKIGFNASDTTLNVFPAMDNKMLMALSEGGMQHLAAGARANVGMKAGRYAYEVKIMEALNPTEAAQGRGPQPKQMVRIGFSTGDSPLLLADNEEAAFFDSEGWFTAGKLRQKKSQLFTRDQTVAVVLNLDSSSELGNTMSIFRDGVRVSEPQPIPESMRNKTLFPHISYRNVSLQINMGPDLLKPLPFECRMLQGAAAADMAEAKDPVKSGRCEVLVPVGVPDEGTFEWLDDYLAKHPSYVELSDRDRKSVV